VREGVSRDGKCESARVQPTEFERRERTLDPGPEAFIIRLYIRRTKGTSILTILRPHVRASHLENVSGGADSGCYGTLDVDVSEIFLKE